jgi:DNA helicase-2/ATP-dependent DNA helicase PcrA
MEFDLRMLRDMTPFAAINYIRNGIHYEDYLEEYASYRHMKKEELTDLLDEIWQSAKPFLTYEQWQAHLEAYQEKLSEKRNAARAPGKKEDAVIFATLHSAKGLEFSEVYLPDVNDGIIPHRKATIDADIEEERRLLYVGMTRAKDHLHIYYTKERYGKSQEPSRFLEVLLEEEVSC